MSHPALTLALALVSVTSFGNAALAQTATTLPDTTQTPAPIVRSTPATPPPAQNPKPKPKPLVLPPPRPADDQGDVSYAVPAAVAKPAKPKPPATSSTSPTGAKPTAAPHPAATPAMQSTPSLPPGQMSPGPFNRNVILLDAAHGGPDTGSRVSDSVLEKDITLVLAFKLRSLLSARGFTVVMTRTGDAATATGSPNPLSLDDRAGIANHNHPVACLLLHATAAGQGVHLYSSELDALPAEPFGTSWLTAQAAWVPQSQRLEKNLGGAFNRAGIPLVASRASVRPLDSMACPALVVELAPSGADSTTLLDGSYQQHVAEAIANALVFWQNQAQPPVRVAPPAAASKSTDASTGSSTSLSTGSSTGVQP